MVTTVGPSGQYNALCDVCGFKKKNWEMRKRWDGLWVCNEDWEPRHPMDFYKTRNDFHKLPFIRSDNDGIDVGPPIYVPPSGLVCSVTQIAPVIGQGTVGCVVVHV